MDGNQSFSGNELTGTSPHTTYNQLEWKAFESTSIQINHRFVDAMPIRDDNMLYSDKYHLFGAGIKHKLNINQKWNLQILGTIDNVLDTRYASMFLINARAFGNAEARYYYPGLPRNFSLRLIISQKT